MNFATLTWVLIDVCVGRSLQGVLSAVIRQWKGRCSNGPSVFLQQVGVYTWLFWLLIVTIKNTLELVFNVVFGILVTYNIS